MSTHSSHFSDFLHRFVLAKLATNSIRVSYTGASESGHSNETFPYSVNSLHNPSMLGQFFLGSIALKAIPYAAGG